MKLHILRFVLLLAGVLGSRGAVAQDFLWRETFNSSLELQGHAIPWTGAVLNTGIPEDPEFQSSGKNVWAVGDEYTSSDNRVDVSVPNQANIAPGADRGIVTPNDGYLYIRNEDVVSATGVGNAHCRPSDASRSICYLGNFCTLGYEKAEVSFFWMGGAAGGAKLYYNADYVGWRAISSDSGKAELKNSPDKWMYEKYTSEVMGNRYNLQLIIVWENDGKGDDTPVLSFGMDDFRLTGFEDPNYTADLIISAGGGPYCPMEGVSIQLMHSRPMCTPAVYTVELSAPDGTFDNGGTRILTTYILDNVDYTRFPVNFPTRIPRVGEASDKYRVRVSRNSDYPSKYIMSNISDAFEVLPEEVCWARVVRTSKPMMVDDKNGGAYTGGCTGDTCIDVLGTLCVNSVFLFTFGTTSLTGHNLFMGDFTDDPDAEDEPRDNEYIAYLSDENGNFPPADKLADEGTVIGHSGVDNFGHSVSVPAPGFAGGKVPEVFRRGAEVPEGCNYYIKVISTVPESNTDNVKPPYWTGERTYDADSVFGPFCIRHCDIELNKQEDIYICYCNEHYKAPDWVVCVDRDNWTPIDLPIVYDYFKEGKRTYGPNHRLKARFRLPNPTDPWLTSWVPVNEPGVLGDTSTAQPGDDVFTLHWPPYNLLSATGMFNPDSGAFQNVPFYLDVISNDTTDKSQLVRLTYGAPSATAPVLFFPNSVPDIFPGEIPLITLGWHEFEADKSSMYEIFVMPSNSPIINQDEIAQWLREIEADERYPQRIAVKGQILYPQEKIWRSDDNEYISEGQMYGECSIYYSNSDPNTRYLFFAVREAGSEWCKGPVSNPAILRVTRETPTSAPPRTTLTDMQVEIYPNPAQDVLHVRSSSGPVDLKVMDMTGRTLMTHRMTAPEETLDFSTPAPGVYLVRITGKAGTIVKKIVRN